MSDERIETLLAAHQERRAEAALRHPDTFRWFDRKFLSDVVQVGLCRGRLVPLKNSFEYLHWNHPLCQGGNPDVDDPLLRKLVGRGDLVVDVGAFGGDTALPMAAAAGDAGLCVAFEPNEAPYTVLAANGWLNRMFCSIWPVQRAIMSQTGTYQFHYSDVDRCNGGYARGTTAGIGVTGHHIPYNVEAVRLDEWLLANVPAALPRWSFCKVDAEGADASILSSHADFFRQWRPAIQTEMYPGLVAIERRHWWDVICSLGYIPTVACERLLTWDEVADATGVIDALCIPA